MSEDGSRRRSTRERRRKIISDHADLAAAGGLAKSTKTDPVSVALENMTSALARVFSAPGASGDAGANLFYVLNGVLHPFSGVFEPNASMDVQENLSRTPAFSAPGASGGTRADLFYGFDGVLHPFSGVFEQRRRQGSNSKRSSPEGSS